MVRGTVGIPWIGLVGVRMSPPTEDRDKAKLFEAFCVQGMDQRGPSALSCMSRTAGMILNELVQDLLLQLDPSKSLWDLVGFI